MTKPLVLSDLQKVARAKRGNIISTKYRNNRTTLKVQCSKRHIWNTNGDKLRQGYWCPYCAGMAKGTIAQMRAIAKARGGKCLSRSYINSASKLEWMCAKGHRWRATPGNVKHKSWCLVCAGKETGTIEAMRALAKSRGGRCLSNTYVNGHSKIQWQCASNHQWFASPSNVKNNGSWCPECKSHLRERHCRAIFENMFGKPFPPSWPKWLKNSRNKVMELDGYCSDLGLAFEHHGKQHYFINNFTMPNRKALKRRQNDDKLKAKLCSLNQIYLFIIPYNIELSKIPELIKKKCFERGINIPHKVDRRTIELKDSYSLNQIQELKKLAKLKGGSLISKKYFGVEIPLTWQCDKGHRWQARPNNIKNSNQWCPKCGRASAAQKQRLSIEDMQKIARSRGGVCLSKKYVNVMTKLKWRCKLGHEWQAIPQHIKNSGSWCPICANANQKGRPPIRR